MTELKIGVIGLGVGEQHALAYAAHPRCRVTMLCDRSQHKRESAMKQFPSSRIMERAEDLLNDPSLDVISIASNDDDHYYHGLTALEAGKHVFVEKPLCRSMEELHCLAKAWRQGGRRRLAANLVLRAAPLYQWARMDRENGEFGRLYAFDGDYLFGRIEKIVSGWRKDVSNYSVMLGGGIHLVDLMLWLTGERPLSVTAIGNRLATEGTAFRYLDYVAATFDFASGLVGRVTANFGCVHRHQHVVRMFGTDKTLIYDDAGARVHCDREPSSSPTVMSGLAPLPATKGALIPAFIDSILAGDQMVENTEHEFNVVSVCVAADRSVSTGQTIGIEYVS